MRHFHRLHDQRGALEGLPLYLIILIVVAAIVVAILVGWLSTLQHPGINSVAVNLNGDDQQVVSQAAYPACNTAAGGDTACFTYNSAANDCSFTLNAHSGSGSPTPPAEALIVTVNDKSGSGLSGATVTITGVNVQITASPSLSAVTGQTSGLGSGDAAFTSITGTIPQGDEAGGSISVSASYSSGGIQTTGSATIDITPPGSITC